MNADLLREHRELQMLRAAFSAAAHKPARRHRVKKGIAGKPKRERLEYLRRRQRKLRQVQKRGGKA